MKPKLPPIGELQAAVFDAFGTLVRIGSRRQSYRQLQRLMARTGASHERTTPSPC